MSALGRQEPVTLKLPDRLLLGVKQPVSASSFSLGDSLQGAMSGRSSFEKRIRIFFQ